MCIEGFGATKFNKNPRNLGELSDMYVAVSTRRYG
jgi:hypothetical protein